MRCRWRPHPGADSKRAERLVNTIRRAVFGANNKRSHQSGANGKHHSPRRVSAPTTSVEQMVNTIRGAIAGAPQPPGARGVAPGAAAFAGSSVTSTIRSSAIASTLAWRSSSAAPRGSRSRARARNKVSPVIGALVHSVSSSSTLTPFAASACETSRTIPGDRCRPARARAAAFADARLAAALDQDGETLIGLERAQRALEPGGRVLLHLDAQDARELAGEARHAALEPVAPVTGDQRRHGFDQSGPVGSEQGEDQGSSHAMKLRQGSIVVPEAGRAPAYNGLTPGGPGRRPPLGGSDALFRATPAAPAEDRSARPPRRVAAHRDPDRAGARARRRAAVDRARGLRELVFKEQYRDLTEYLQGFAYTCAVLTDAEALERAAFELGRTVWTKASAMSRSASRRSSTCGRASTWRR